MLRFISYTLSDKITYNLVHSFVDIPIWLPEIYDMQNFLEVLYPMYTVYIQNIGKIDSGISDAERILGMTAEDITYIPEEYDSED